MEKVKKSKANTIVNIILWVFMIIAFGATVVAFLANSSGKGYPVVGNTSFICISSDSMKGKEGFSKGTLIFSKVLSTDEEKQSLEVGDVITFWYDVDLDGEDELNTHKIIAVDTVGRVTYTTHGINNPEGMNETVGWEDVEAVWKTGHKIPVLGGIINFLQSSVGFLCCIVLPIACIFIYQIVSFVKAISEFKNKDKRMISKEDEEEIKKRAIEEFLAKQKEAENK